MRKRGKLLILYVFKTKTDFTLQEAYAQNREKPKETVRARIYDNIGIKFERVAKGLYRTIQGQESCVLLEGDGRDLSILEDNSLSTSIVSKDCPLTTST